MATHISESESEVRYLHDGGGPWSAIPWLVDPPGTTGTRLLAREGLLGPHVLAAHCVALDGEEIDILAEHGVAIAHCPRSNAYVGCGIAPLREFRQAGLRVGIGTDQDEFWMEEVVDRRPHGNERRVVHQSGVVVQEGLDLTVNRAG